MTIDIFHICFYLFGANVVYRLYSALVYKNYMQLLAITGGGKSSAPAPVAPVAPASSVPATNSAAQQAATQQSQQRVAAAQGLAGSMATPGSPTSIANPAQLVTATPTLMAGGTPAANANAIATQGTGTAIQSNNQNV